MSLPNALIGGAPKCGTTSLADALVGHPDVFIPFKKELSFFHVDSQYGLGLDWYARFFDEGVTKKLRLEATPDYLASETACARIRRDLPECRIVFLIRDPVARAHSHYWFRARSRRESRTFLDALRDEQRSGQGYLISYGRYASQLRRYFDAFDRRQILVMRFSELTHRPAQSLRLVQEFLGVSTLVTSLPKNNAASEPRSEVAQSALQELTRNQGAAKQALRALVPDSLRYKVRRKISRLNARPASKPSMNTAERQILVDSFEPELEDLEALLGLNLEDWRTAWLGPT